MGVNISWTLKEFSRVQETWADVPFSQHLCINFCCCDGNFFFFKLKSLMRPPKSVRNRQDQVKTRIPTTKPSKHIAKQHVAGKTQHISSSGFTEPSGSNLPPDPALKEWKQVGETKDSLIPNPSGTNSAGVLFQQCVHESEWTASQQENSHSKE